MHTLDYNTYPGILTLPASKYGQILATPHKNLLQKHRYPARKQNIHKKNGAMPLHRAVPCFSFPAGMHQ